MHRQEKQQLISFARYMIKPLKRLERLMQKYLRLMNLWLKMEIILIRLRIS